LPPLEAMACGVPVITSNTSSMPEVCGNAALFVEPTDVDSIADGIRRLAASETLRADLRQRGLERVKQFTWERTVEATWQALEQAQER
jgi:glycosyltransferase involved in cell wall biosynthesis